MVKMRLHILLAEHRMTQKELSIATGIRQGTISTYASDTCKHIVKRHIDILCIYFNCDITDLIQFKHTPLK